MSLQVRVRYDDGDVVDHQPEEVYAENRAGPESEIVPAVPAEADADAKDAAGSAPGETEPEASLLPSDTEAITICAEKKMKNEKGNLFHQFLPNLVSLSNIFCHVANKLC